MDAKKGARFRAPFIFPTIRWDQKRMPTPPTTW